MDPRPPRVAYSFDAGTIELHKWCPGLCEVGPTTGSTMVCLDKRWELLLGGLRQLGVILASVRSGPVNLASVWRQVDFQPIPGSHEWLEINSGTELRGGALGSAVALVEERGDQQVASLQFAARDGTEYLKLMLTENSDLEAFEQLVKTHAVAGAWGSPTTVQAGSNGPGLVTEPVSVPVSVSVSVPVPVPVPDWESVKPLWEGLSRTRPGRYFPGLALVPRLAGLQAANGAFAWPLQPKVARTLLEKMAERGEGLNFSVRNRAVFMSAACTLGRSRERGCGQTFFGPQTQLTLRCHGGEPWSTWVVCLRTLRGEQWKMEVYDERGEFCLSVGLGNASAVGEEVFWRTHLLEGRLP
jgi:putative heme degradation protein